MPNSFVLFFQHRLYFSWLSEYGCWEVVFQISQKRTILLHSQIPLGPASWPIGIWLHSMLGSCSHQVSWAMIGRWAAYRWWNLCWTLATQQLLFWLLWQHFWCTLLCSPRILMWVNITKAVVNILYFFRARSLSVTCYWQMLTLLTIFTLLCVFGTTGDFYSSWLTYVTMKIICKALFVAALIS